MSEKVTNVTDADFEDAVLKSEVPVLVDFWAAWCGPCKMMGPVLDAFAEEADEKQIVVTKLNVDENPATTAKYGVMTIPTMVLFKGGEEVGRLKGFMPKEEFAKQVGALL